MAWALLNSQTSVDTKENGNKDRCQDKVSSAGQTETGTKEGIKAD
jgi:hypothetical protein